jgi:ribosome biogenesis GTPase
MLHIDFDRLQRVGLTPALADRARACAADGDPRLDLLRVTSVHRETVQLHDGVGEGPARRCRASRASCSRRHDARRRRLGARLARRRRRALGAARVPPLSHIARRDGDGSRHPVVSNVDWALLVMGLDDDFNLRRLERYLTLVYASGVAPVVVLTKADIAAADPACATSASPRSASASRRGADAGRRRHRSAEREPLRARRLRRPDAGAARLVGRGQVDPHQHPARRGGPGHRCGARARQPRHAHDHRALAAPAARRRVRHRHAGLRTLRPDIDEATLAASFGDVETLAGRCRFRDCAHGDEPGCAVRDGVDPDRLRNFQKLLRETRRDSLTWVERRQQLSAWKSRGKDTRMRMKMKRGDG